MTTWETRSPKPKPPNAVGRDGLTSLLTTGIVNPMGPTLNVLAIDGTLEVGATRTVVHLMLHPFSTQAWRVGTCRDLSAEDLVDGIETYFPHLWQDAGCPTLLIPSSLLDDDQAIATYAHFLEGFPGGRVTAALVESHPGDPWKRVESEMKNTKLDDLDDSPMAKDAALSFAQLQLEPANLKAEFEAFLFAWRGSIKFQDEVGSPLADSAMSADELVNYLALLAMTSRIPGVSV